VGWKGDINQAAILMEDNNKAEILAEVKVQGLVSLRRARTNLWYIITSMQRRSEI
jgi:hypothetical protein